MWDADTYVFCYYTGPLPGIYNVLYTVEDMCKTFAGDKVQYVSIIRPDIAVWGVSVITPQIQKMYIALVASLCIKYCIDLDDVKMITIGGDVDEPLES